MRTALAIVHPHRARWEAPKAPSTENGRPGKSQEQPGKKRVLIVEDEAILALVFRDALEAGGYEVVGTAASARAAIRKAGETLPDLVLMDIRLRGSSDGVAAAIEIRTRFDIPSLFVSAHIGPAVQARAAPARPAGFVAKPCRAEELLERVREVLESAEDS